MNFTVSSEHELVKKVWTELASKLKAPFRVALIGDLGTGKTTLAQGLMKKLGVNEPITSPTFNICKIYHLDSAVFQHIDLYRYGKASNDKEIEEYISYPEAITFVEWPENLSYPLEKYDVVIKLKALGQNSREVQISWN